MILFSKISCSLVATTWLQDHLLPCPFKYLTGIDCPGCGFQRSVLALMHGNLQQSLGLYPAAIPLILLFIFGFADRAFKLDTKKESIKKTAYLLVASLIAVTYCIKMVHVYMHYRLSLSA